MIENLASMLMHRGWMLTTAESCQLETWVRTYKDSHEVWALPACNPTGNLEFTVGGGRAWSYGQRATSDYVFQLKTLFRPLVTNGWGWGLGVGTVRHPGVNPGPNLLGNVYAYVPMSFSLRDDQVVVHANVGWLRDRASREHNLTWGLGGEIRLTNRVLGIVETFGDHRHRGHEGAGGQGAGVEVDVGGHADAQLRRRLQHLQLHLKGGDVVELLGPRGDLPHPRGEAAIGARIPEVPEGYGIEVRMTEEDQITFTGVSRRQPMISPGFLLRVDHPVARAAAAAVGSTTLVTPCRCTSMRVPGAVSMVTR